VDGAVDRDLEEIGVKAEHLDEEQGVTTFSSGFFRYLQIEDEPSNPEMIQRPAAHGGRG